MSIEQLLLLLILAGVPLLKRLIGTLRARADGASVDRLPVPHQRSTVNRGPNVSSPHAEPRTVEPPRELPLPTLPSPPSPPLHTSPAPEHPGWSGPDPRVPVSRHVPATGGHAWHTEDTPAIRRITSIGDMRSAIANMAILEPCKAMASKEP